MSTAVLNPEATEATTPESPANPARRWSGRRTCMLIAAVVVALAVIGSVVGVALARRADAAERWDAASCGRMADIAEDTDDPTTTLAALMVLKKHACDELPIWAGR